MLESSSGNPETQTERAVSTAYEMRQAIRPPRGPPRETDTRESRIARAARAAGISFRQAKSLFYREATDPKSSVVERVRAAMAKANQPCQRAGRPRPKTCPSLLLLFSRLMRTSVARFLLWCSSGSRATALKIAPWIEDDEHQDQ